MNKFLKVLITIIFLLTLFFGIVIFGGHEFCWLPGKTLSNPPTPTFGCFYSS